MLDTASRIHSANGGVRASQARNDEPVAFTDSVCVSGAMLILPNRPWVNGKEVCCIGEENIYLYEYEPRREWHRH